MLLGYADVDAREKGNNSLYISKLRCLPACYQDGGPLLCESACLPELACSRPQMIDRDVCFRKDRHRFSFSILSPLFAVLPHQPMICASCRMTVELWSTGKDPADLRVTGDVMMRVGTGGAFHEWGCTEEGTRGPLGFRKGKLVGASMFGGRTRSLRWVSGSLGRLWFTGDFESRYRTGMANNPQVDDLTPLLGVPTHVKQTVAPMNMSYHLPNQRRMFVG